MSQLINGKFKQNIRKSLIQNGHHIPCQKKFFGSKHDKYNTNFRRFVTKCSIKARWCIDVKFGFKGQALESVTDWVQTIGQKAGLSEDNTTIQNGAVGVPESRIELEVAFESIAQLEEFWGKISPTLHKAWSQQAQQFIIDGSPQWQVYRTTNPFLREQQQVYGQTAQQSQDQKQFVEVGDSGLVVPLDMDMKDIDKMVQPQQRNDGDQVLDWKGEPMKINPGDKLPFKFQ
eukprot:TRINITY_DN474_c2_g1_i4.p1 TRINITY_DN474_c2_g1~~TRINITY_DN474_c2_g1_i4.p1  ORF type:complete len:231 (+),score=23.25 TRINITY_DN474_c2_g1_i4:30-722(+)